MLLLSLVLLFLYYVFLVVLVFLFCSHVGFSLLYALSALFVLLSVDLIFSRYSGFVIDGLFVVF
jgi:hypothetical protein